MRENNFMPGNFRALNVGSKEKVAAMVNRLNYDPYERRDQLTLSDNPGKN